MMTTFDQLASLRFEGPRFDTHALDLECVVELLAYQKLVAECAKALWMERNPTKPQLPKGFEANFRLEMRSLEQGSTLVPVLRVRPKSGALRLGVEDDFDFAATLIDRAIAAAHSGQTLPRDFPASVVASFQNFGKSLREDETLFVQSRKTTTAAAYSPRARKVLREWKPSSYTDRVNLVGTVVMADVSGSTFQIRLDGGSPKVKGKFTEEQRTVVLEALKNYTQLRLRIIGRAKYSAETGQILALTQVDTVSSMSVDQLATFDASVTPIWETIFNLTANIPESTWDEVPHDLSIRVDEYLKGKYEKKN